MYKDNAKKGSKIHKVQLVIIVVLSLLMSACVTKSNSSLTDKADPEVAVERYVQLGLEYIKRNELHRARKHLSRALEINPIDASANASMGLIYHQEGENEKAEGLFKKALDADPNYTPGRSYFGAYLFAQHRYQEALQQFETAAKDTRYEGRTQIFSNIALCQIQLGNNKGAIDAYQKSLQLDRVNGIALSGITELFILNGSFDKSQHYYNRLVRLIREKGMRHTAQSLWQGIRIANYFDSRDQALGLSYLLNEMYPDSEENAAAHTLLDSGKTNQMQINKSGVH
jgi:type IV pilus assembly protein PilF